MRAQAVRLLWRLHMCVCELALKGGGGLAQRETLSLKEERWLCRQVPSAGAYVQQGEALLYGSAPGMMRSRADMLINGGRALSEQHALSLLCTSGALELANLKQLSVALRVCTKRSIHARRPVQQLPSQHPCLPPRQ